MNHSTTITKKCSTCHTEYPATNEYFAKDKNRDDGLYLQCKLCVKKYKENRAKPEYEPTGELKLCTQCGNTYTGTLEHFIANKYSRDGLSTYCRDCTRENRRKKTGFYDKPIASEGMKICSKCDREFPATTEYFCVNKNKKDGLHIWCNECRIENKRQSTGYYDRQPTKGYKRCTKCEKEHPATLEYFYENESGKFGLSPVCRKCQQKISLKWAIENPEEQKKRAKHWREQNPEKAAALGRNRESRMLGNGGKHTSEDVKHQLELQQRKCYYCGKDLDKKYHVDHVIPISRGGRNDSQNLVCACAKCNTSKHNAYLTEWLSRITDPALRYNVQLRIAERAELQ